MEKIKKKDGRANNGGARPGAGRKKKADKKQVISPSVTPAFKQWLAKYAREVSISQGELIETAVSKIYLHKYKKRGGHG